MRTAIANLIAAIDAWKASKRGAASMRSNEVTLLDNEAKQWQQQLIAWQIGYSAQVFQHDQDRRSVQAWIDHGVNQHADLRLRNACQWVTTKLRFYVVTEVPDHKYRAAATQHADPGTIADNTRVFFPDPHHGGAGDLAHDPAVPNWDNLADPTNVFVKAHGENTMGWCAGGDHIVVTEKGVRAGQGRLEQTLRHEVQHDADKNKGKELKAGEKNAKQQKQAAEATYTALQGLAHAAGGVGAAQANFDAHVGSDAYALRNAKVDAEVALRRYKTEYRAHSYQGNPAWDALDANPANLVPHEHYQWTARQWAIFRKIRAGASYTYVQNSWGINGQPPAHEVQRLFREAIVAYKNPDTEGYNKLDSVRIDALYTALSKVKPTTDPANKKFQDVLKAVDDFRWSDTHYVQDATQSVDLNTKITAALGPAGAPLRTLFDQHLNAP
jgi:hypothetical protein